MKSLQAISRATAACAAVLLAAGCMIAPEGSISQDIEHTTTSGTRSGALELVVPEDIQNKVLESRGTSVGPLSQVRVRIGSDLTRVARDEARVHYETVTLVPERTNAAVDRVTIRELDADMDKTDLDLDLGVLVQLARAGETTREVRIESTGKGSGADIFRSGGTGADAVVGGAREEALQDFVRKFGTELNRLKAAPAAQAGEPRPPKSEPMPGNRSGASPRAPEIAPEARRVRPQPRSR